VLTWLTILPFVFYSQAAAEVRMKLAFDKTYFEQLLAEVCDLSNKSSILSDALRHHFASGGSRTRARLCFNFAACFSLPEKTAYYLACIPELLHNASLIHDDIQDLDVWRRNAPSLWKKFGSDIAICAGDYLISSAYFCLSRYETKAAPALLVCIHEHVKSVIHGQTNDLTQKKDQSLNDLPLYFQICAQKSGELLSMCLTLPLLETNQAYYLSIAKQVFADFSIAYQVYDDLNDLEEDQAKVGLSSAVNIVSIMQQNHVAAPRQASIDLAQSHLQRAQAQLALLPQPCQPILQQEISRLLAKLPIPA
jgi:geranylgeranyl diphosphate synthase type II